VCERCDDDDEDMCDGEECDDQRCDVDPERCDDVEL
jgi:hypothetical protein